MGNNPWFIIVSAATWSFEMVHSYGLPCFLSTTGPWWVGILDDFQIDRSPNCSFRRLISETRSATDFASGDVRHNNCKGTLVETNPVGSCVTIWSILLLHGSCRQNRKVPWFPQSSLQNPDCTCFSNPLGRFCKSSLLRPRRRRFFRPPASRSSELHCFP